MGRGNGQERRDVGGSGSGRSGSTKPGLSRSLKPVGPARRGHGRSPNKPIITDDDLPTPPESPQLPIFEPLSGSASNGEKKAFWRNYRSVVHDFNVQAIAFMGKQKLYKKEVRSIQDPVGQSKLIGLSTAMDRIRMEREMAMQASYFETSAFVIKRSAFPQKEWYKSSCLDLSGHLGTLEYKSQKEVDDFFQVDFTNSVTPFMFNKVRFNLEIFTFIERSVRLKGTLSTGFRITFPKAAAEVSDGTFKITVTLQTLQERPIVLE